jgi:predicted Zn-dependent protease
MVVPVVWLTGIRKVKTSAEVEAALAKLLGEYEKKPIAVTGESLLGFARFDELEADRVAFYNTYKAGYNPCALASVLKRMARLEKEEMGKDQYRQYQVKSLTYGQALPVVLQRLLVVAPDPVDTPNVVK